MINEGVIGKRERRITYSEEHKRVTVTRVDF